MLRETQFFVGPDLVSGRASVGGTQIIRGLTQGQALRVAQHRIIKNKPKKLTAKDAKNAKNEKMKLKKQQPPAFSAFSAFSSFAPLASFAVK
jgi:hypothetical protein